MFRAAAHFEALNSRKELEQFQREKWFIAAKEQREKKEQQSDQIEQALTELAAAVVTMAEPVQIQTFQAEITEYDASTIQAILENKHILENLYQKRDEMLDSAYQLEDGRRVFKSEDGKRVYDEEGQLVSPDIIHPDEIEDFRPKAEDYLGVLDDINKHKDIEQKLHDYQDKLDAAQERLENGEISQKELDDLRKSLQDEMPIEVRRKLPDYDPSQEQATDITQALQTEAPKLTAADTKIDPALIPG